MKHGVVTVVALWLLLALTMACTQKMRDALGVLKDSENKPYCWTERGDKCEPMTCCVPAWEDYNKTVPTCTRWNIQ